MRLLRGASLTTVLAVIGGSAFAQAPTGLEEIVVTAQKREENLQRVPIAVTAITAGQLSSGGVRSSQDLQFAIPSLVFSKTGNFGQPFLRGIGSTLTIPNADPSVTTYVDGVVVSTSASIIQQLMGVERVEVLSGPQGTLYGRNATGGAINIYTLTPRQELDGAITLTGGNFALKEASGHLSGGITKKLAVGIYATVSDRHSYLTKDNPSPGPGPNRETNYGVRVKAVYEPTDAVKLTGSLEYMNVTSLESGTFRNIQANSLPYTLGAPLVDPYHAAANVFSGGISNVYAGTLREEIDLGWAKVLGITGYRRFTQRQGDDLDGTVLPILAATSMPAFSTQQSQELQLLSPDDSAIKWIAGLFYLHEYAGLTPVSIPSQVLFPAPIGGLNTNTTVQLDSYAAFAQATVPLNRLVEGLSVTLGARYTIDHKKWKASGYAIDFFDNPIPGTDVTYPTTQTNFYSFSPKATLSYEFGSSLVYFTYVKGYKAGAYNLSSPSFPMPDPVNPEKLTDYEIGFKSTFAKNRMRIKGAAYHYNYADIQISAIQGGTSGTTTLQNAGKAKLYGVEGSLDAKVTQDLTFSGNLAWENATYTSFPNASSFFLTPLGNAQVQFDATGKNLPRAPKWVGSVALNYSHQLANDGTVELSANAAYHGSFYWESTNRLRQSAYVVANLRAGYTFPGDHLTLSVFANNIANAYYASVREFFPVGIGTMDAPPRMFGGSISWKL